MTDFNDKFNFPSGVQLPFLLRKKVEEQRARAAQDPDAAKEKSTTFLTSATVPQVGAEVSELEDIPNRSFTSEEFQDKIWRASVALVEIQKQINRGEETYYEETQNTGNVFKGWEGLLDAKDVGAISNSKPPRDTRWFSGSSSIKKLSAQWSNIAHQPRLPTPNASTVVAPPVVSKSAPLVVKAAPPVVAPSAAIAQPKPVKAAAPVVPAPVPARSAAPATAPAPVASPASAPPTPKPTTPPAPKSAVAPAPVPAPVMKPPPKAPAQAVPKKAPSPTTAATSTPTKATAAPKAAPAPAPVPKAGTANPIAPAKQLAPEATAAKPSDSFRIPKKKKKTDASAKSAAAGASSAAASAASTSPQSKSPVDTKQTTNVQYTASTEASDSKKGGSEPAPPKKTKGRKRKGFD